MGPEPEQGRRKELTSSSGAPYRLCRASELDLVVDVKLGRKVRGHSEKLSSGMEGALPG